jgi:hypothetical protein
MSVRNHYAVGRAWESVGYPVNGEADDWSYGTHGAVSMTIEVGNSRDSFWPPPSRILPLAQESLWPATYLAWAAGPHLQLASLRLEPSARSSTVNSSSAGSIHTGSANSGSASSGSAGGSTTGTGTSVDAGHAGLGLTLAVQANGLMGVRAAHAICACTLPDSAAQLLPSPGWASEATDAPPPASSHVLSSRSAAAYAPSLSERCAQPALCSELPGLNARSSVTLPPLRLTSAAAGRVLLRWQRPHAATSSAVGNTSSEAPLEGLEGDGVAAGSALVVAMDMSATTLSNCAATPELCMCAPDNAGVRAYSHTCRAALPPGSHCMVPKPARTGENSASGTIDEFFSYVPTARGVAADPPWDPTPPHSPRDPTPMTWQVRAKRHGHVPRVGEQA